MLEKPSGYTNGELHGQQAETLLDARLISSKACDWRIPLEL